MKVLLIIPEFRQPIITIKGDYKTAKEAIESFLIEKELESDWFIEFNGFWDVYLKKNTPDLIYQGTVEQVLSR